MGVLTFVGDGGLGLDVRGVKKRGWTGEDVPGLRTGVRVAQEVAVDQMGIWWCIAATVGGERPKGVAPFGRSLSE